METISYAFHAVMPLLLTIAMGYFLTRMGRWDRSFFSRLSSLCYRILLPIQLFYNVYQIEALSDVNWRVVLYTLIWVPIGILVGIGAAKLFIPDRRQKGVLVQAVFRSNQAILGMPLTQSLGGEAAVAVTSVVTSLGIPLYNISAVIVLETYCQRDGKKNESALHRQGYCYKSADHRCLHGAFLRTDPPFYSTGRRCTGLHTTVSVTVSV